MKSCPILNDTKKNLNKKTKYNKAEHVFTDCYKCYESIVTKSKHIQSKAETYTLEDYNNLFRHFLERIRRKTKCYSKCERICLFFFFYDRIQCRINYPNFWICYWSSNMRLIFRMNR